MNSKSSEISSNLLNEELQKSETKYRNLVETSNDLIWSVDIEGRLTFLNRNATLQIYGYEPEEMLGRHFSEFEPTEQVPKDLEVFEKVKSGIPYFKYDTTQIRKDGKIVHLRVNAIVAKDLEGNTIGATGTASDITEQKKYEELLKAKSEALERSNKALEEFAYIASHDLQEPLYIITAFLDKIRNQYEANLDKQVNFLIHRVYNAALRMTHLIHDLLNYARINTRKKPFEEVDLNTVVKEVWNDLELRAKEAHAHLIVENLPTLYSDKLQFTQLFMNLLSNSLKFKKEDEPIHIKISSRPLNDKMTEITIEDDGIGFEEEFVEKIFQPFQRLHPKNVYEGNGMGLAICKKIVERHHGSIQAHSQQNVGTKFFITLPLTPSASKDF